MDRSQSISNLFAYTKWWLGSWKCNMGYSSQLIWYPNHAVSSFISLRLQPLFKKRYSSTLLDDLDFTPASDHWSLPPQSLVILHKMKIKR